MSGKRLAVWLLGLSLVPAVASGAPRVGIVVVSHPGIPTDESDGIAYDLAGDIASQIEGEAIAGQSMRDLLPEGAPAPGCAEDPGCGRELATAVKTDEILFLEMKRKGKNVMVTCHRVARDPERIPAEGVLTLTGTQAKRSRAVTELVSSLYPAGSVVPFVEREATEPAEKEAADVRVKAAPAPEPEPESQPIYRRKWFWPAVGAGAGAVALAVILGVALGTSASPSAPSIALP